MKRSLSQNFIFDLNFLSGLADLADLQGRNILEAGSGQGTLTSVLADRAAGVVSVEIDKDIFPALEEKFKKRGNVILFNGDFLKMDTGFLKGKRWTFFSNIPYHISTHVIERLILLMEHFDEYYMTVQYEFAKRLFAAPGGKDYGSLSIFFQMHFSGRILKKVPASVFVPRPKVDSAFICFKNDIKAGVDDRFFTFVRSLFSQRRKNMLNNLLKNCDNYGKNDIISILRESGINEKQRIENLNYSVIFDLYNRLFGK